MIILLAYLLLCSLTAGPSAIWAFNQVISNKLTKRTKLLILWGIPLTVIILGAAFSSLLIGTTIHLPEALTENPETKNAEIRGTQILICTLATIVFIATYLSTLGTCLKMFGDTEIEDAEDE